VNYPIAVDSGYVIWRGFDNNYWPALYFIDAQGRTRHHYFGEGAYEQSEMIIQRLLAEAGVGGVSDDLGSVDARGLEPAADWGSLKSPENYVGYERTQNFMSPGGAVSDRPRVYALPARLRLNDWALSGNWTVKKGAAALNEPNGTIAYRFHARDLHLVMGPATPGTSVRFRVRIDGMPPGAAHGADVDEQGNGMASEQRLYQLIRQPQPIPHPQVETAVLRPAPIGSSKSSFSLRAWRLLPSRSADPRHQITEVTMNKIKIVLGINQDRRLFCGRAAMASAAAQLGMIAPAAAQRTEVKVPAVK